MGNTKVAKLNLRLRPGKCGRTRKRGRVAVAINKIKQRVGRGGNHSPERNSGDSAGGHADPSADGKDRVKDCADGAGQGRPDHRGCARIPTTPDEFGAVCLNLHRCGFRPFDHRNMGGPNLGVVGGTAAAGGDDDAQFGKVVGHHEHLGKRRMC